MNVVEGCGAGTGSADTSIGLLTATVADAGADEGTHKLSLVTCVLDHTHDFCVSMRRDSIGMTDEANFVLVLDNTASFDCVLEQVPVGLLEGKESDMVCNLLGNGQDGFVRGFRRCQV